jgi:Holliday junction resolvase RusA-like endonuclease
LSTEERIVLPVVPVSAQGSAQAKKAIRETVKREAERIGRYFVGEVAVQVEWLLHERRRWEGPGVLGTPDVDNVIKPLVDALCGLSGILIDDCQVQSIHCGWIDWPHEDKQQITLTIRPLMQDEWLPRGPLVGIEAEDGFCLPMLDDQPPDGVLLLLDGFERLWGLYEEARQRGIPEEKAALLRPSVRRLHREQFRRHGFPVVPLEEYRSQLRSRMSATTSERAAAGRRARRAPQR